MRRISMLVCLAALAARGATAQNVADVLTAGRVRVSGGTGPVRVPVWLRDVAGTPLGWDHGPHERIDQLAFVVAYGPNPCLDTVAPYFDRSTGILRGIDVDSPNMIEARPKIAHEAQGYLFSMPESDGLIPFTNADAPGDLLGELVFEMTGCGSDPIYLSFRVAAVSSDMNVREDPAAETGWIAPDGAVVPTPTVTPTAEPTQSWVPRTPTATPTWDPRTPTRTVTPTRTPTRTPTVTPTYDPRFPTPTPEIITSGGPAPGPPPPPPARDVVALPNMAVPLGASRVRVPVYVQDVAWTSLDRHDDPGSAISRIELKVVYGPNRCVDTVPPYFDTRDGLLSAIAPDVLETPRVPHESQSVVVEVDPSRALIPFLNDYPPGDKLGDLVFALTGCSDPIYLDLDASASRLAGTWAVESVALGGLDLWSGSIGFGAVAPPRTPAPAATPTGSRTPTTTPTATPTRDAASAPSSGPVAVPVAGPSGLALLGLALAAAGLVLARRLAR